MTQLVLDDHLSIPRILPALQKWITAEYLHDLRPEERILDDRVPQILLTLRQPTFVTIDRDFWHPRWCHPEYCILYFALEDDDQPLIPDLLRALFRYPEFHSRAARIGKLARVSTTTIAYWEYPVHEVKHMVWPKKRRKR